MSENGSLDLAQLEPILRKHAPLGRPALLPALHDAQALYGYLPESVASAVGRALGVPLADVYGVIDFYALYYREPVGRTVVHVCADPACALADGEGVLNRVCQHLNINRGETSADGEFTVERAPCLGLCEFAPAALVGSAAYAHVDNVAPEALLSGQAERPASIVAGDIRILTGNCGRGRATTLHEYEATGGFAALRKVLGEMTPEAVVAEVKASGLVGRGGAAFPTGIKWEGAARAEGSPKYAVCNADESEPGTFKDRVLMEEDPFSAIEGLILAGYAIGASQGYYYVRGEYPHAADVLRDAIRQARTAGYLGANVLGTNFSFDIELRVGAGAYICGEETALFESIEGKRGFPRVKPPFPTMHGLFGKPTVINNVETLANVPYLLRVGAAGYRQIGTEKSPGPKLFCVSGDVARPGIYEVPFGVTIRHLLNDLAGGVTGGDLQAVLFGGAAGAFATPDQLDVRMSFEDLRAAGLPLGSGVVMVFNDRRDLRDVLLRLGHFFADESCGKCYPCQIGTQRQYEILERVAASRPAPGDVERLTDVGWTMTDASLCGLGQTAATAVLSALKLWPAMFTEQYAAPTPAPLAVMPAAADQGQAERPAPKKQAAKKAPAAKKPATAKGKKAAAKKKTAAQKKTTGKKAAAKKAKAPAKKKAAVTKAKAPAKKQASAKKKGKPAARTKQTAKRKPAAAKKKPAVKKKAATKSKKQQRKKK